MSSVRRTVAAVLSLATLSPLLAHATDLSGAMTADNAFTLYLSTDDSVAGTPLLSGDSWGVTFTLAAASLAPASTYYLHVVATDFGPPASLIGNMSLSDSGFSFANGGQTLVTNTTDWTVRVSGFADTDQTPVSLGFNGVGPWGTRAGISGNAENIWSPDLCGSCTRYFSTTITSAVPEPGGLPLLALGLAVVGATVRRRS